MNPEAYRYTSLLKIASHNHSGGTWAGEESSANFQVDIRDEISEIGSIEALSIDTVCFPNLFPNVAPPNNEFIAREMSPIGDGFTVPAQNFDFSIQHPNRVFISYTLVFPGAIDSPAVAIAFNTAFATQFGFVSPPTFTMTPNGSFVIQSLDPLGLISDSWNSLLGFQNDGSVFYNTVYHGYPLSFTTFHSVLVPQAFYTQEQLGDALTKLLDDSFVRPAGTWTINPNPIDLDQRYHLRNSASTFIVTRRIPPQPSHSDLRHLCHQMGFFDLPEVFLPDLQAPYDPHLFGANAVYLFSNILASGMKAYDGEGIPQSVIATIPITVGYGFQQTQVLNQWNGPQTRYKAGISPKVIDISLRDVYGDIMFLPPNQQLIVTFKLWFEAKSIHDVGGRN
jgi:hypothetical protein